MRLPANSSHPGGADASTSVSWPQSLKVHGLHVYLAKHLSDLFGYAPRSSAGLRITLDD